MLGRELRGTENIVRQAIGGFALQVSIDGLGNVRFTVNDREGKLANATLTPGAANQVAWFLHSSRRRITAVRRARRKRN